MKIIKKVGILLTLLSFPIQTFAYSDKVILGGQNVGISINSKGILIVGFYKVNGVYNGSKLLAGDYIEKIGDVSVNNVNELIKAIEDNVKDNKVEITYRRNDKSFKTNLKLEYKDGTYKTGLYVKDNLLGNGTISYVDPTTNVYGALGHYILESNTNSKVEIKDGSIFQSVITSITKSTDGNPGSINTKFNRKSIYGSIDENTDVGIFGKFNQAIDDDELIEIADISEVKLGKAMIFTSLDNKEIKEYEINIIKIEKNSDIKNFYFEVTDSKLLETTGGIVQGMSGSPIVQNNKLIGAVTHVTIDNVKTGYGISIKKMLEEGDKILNS